MVGMMCRGAPFTRLLKRPCDIGALKMLCKSKAIAPDELPKCHPHDFRFVEKPTILDQPVQLFGKAFR